MYLVLSLYILKECIDYYWEKPLFIVYDHCEEYWIMQEKKGPFSYAEVQALSTFGNFSD